MNETAYLAGYLRRIGLPDDVEVWRPVPGDLGVRRLAALAEAHLATVPFENLDIHGGLPVSVEYDRLLAKIVGQRRGGICYELNGGLGWLLGRLGWTVEHRAGRVVGDTGLPGLPLGHVALVVAVPDGPRGGYLLDVGFDGEMTLAPLEEVGTPAVDGLAAHGHEIAVRRSPGAAPGYLLETRARGLAEFAGMAWWHSTAPEARFVRSLVCTVTRDGVRTTLSGRGLKTTAPGGQVEERELRTAAEVLSVYRDHFGLALDQEPVRRDPSARC